MTDESVAARIERLVTEEHELLQQEQRDRTDTERLDHDHERLEDVRVELDRCWDLLRQRRAHREFAQDPNESRTRPREQVEGYLQ